MKLKLSFAALAILVLASVLLVACTSSPGEDISAPGNTSTVEVAPTGEEIFASNCAAYHGADGEGQPDWHVRKTDGTLPPPPLNGDGHTWHYADGLLYEIVSQGGKMLEDPRNTLNKGSEGVSGGYWGSFAEILRPPGLFSQMCRPLIALRRGRCNL